MLFTSAEYLLFLPAIVALFWILPHRFRLPMLLIASYGFYMSFIPAFILLIAPMTLFNWLWGKVLYKDHENRVILGVGIVVNLLILGYFKYANFFADTFSHIIKMTGAADPHWTFNIILPLGISFFTFEYIHYLFEIRRGNKPIDSFVLFSLFAAFFPTQIAGPIKRYPDFVAQMQAETKLKLSYFDEGIPLIIIGMAKKLLLADNLATFVQMGVSAPSMYSGPELWLFAYAFAFQIYFDFSGYTDIGRGSAMLFGYHIPLNFNMPYIARNMSDFWRRWHISLSSWLRDYLFIPLGGSKGGRWQTNRNLFLTMALGGLWHGASWNFVIWGVYHDRAPRVFAVAFDAGLVRRFAQATGAGKSLALYGHASHFPCGLHRLGLLPHSKYRCRLHHGAAHGHPPSFLLHAFTRALPGDEARPAGGSTGGDDHGGDFDDCQLAGLFSQ
jgi:alginate O-acetyltransferase complex protein AlgI